MIQGHRSMPVLHVGDVDETAGWFHGLLGFDLAGQWKNDEGLATFAIVQLDSITVALTKSKVPAPHGDQWAAYFYVEDVSTLSDEILAKAAPILRGPEDTFYGCREIEIADPSGNRLCFAQDLRPGPDGPGL